MVSSYATLTRQDRTGKSTTQNTTVSIGCRYEAVAPEGKVSALVPLNVPKVTAPIATTCPPFSHEKRLALQSPDNTNRKSCDLALGPTLECSGAVVRDVRHSSKLL
jgi:hypothetical protein